jgi:hypothetical protein
MHPRTATFIVLEPTDSNTKTICSCFIITLASFFAGFIIIAEKR